MIFETVRMAVGSILGSKARSFLTMLGIIIGVGSVVMFMAVGEGLRRDVSHEITSLGSNVLTVIPGKLSGGAPNTSALSGDVLEPADAADIAALPGVRDVAQMSLVGGTVRAGTTPAPSALLLGVTPNFLDLYGVIELGSGRFFTPAEDTRRDRVIVLGPTVATALFGDADPVGKQVTVGKEDFSVIGVTKVSESNSLVSGDLAAMTLIPHGTSNDLAGSDRIFRMIVRLKDGVDTKTYKETVTSALLARHHDDEVSVLSSDDLVGVVDTVLTLLTAAITGIAAISLLVAGVGIMNIMLVSVTERTKEIGIRKAVGATTGAILLQFLVESVILSLLGSAVAVGLAYGAAMLVTRFSTLSPAVTPAAVALAASVGVIVGLVFGIAPAYRAAKLDPIKALRWE